MNAWVNFERIFFNSLLATFLLFFFFRNLHFFDQGQDHYHDHAGGGGVGLVGWLPTAPSLGTYPATLGTRLPLRRQKYGGQGTTQGVLLKVFKTTQGAFKIF